MKLKKQPPPTALEAGRHEVRRRHVPALHRTHDDRSNDVPWVPMLRQRAGGCWRGAGPRLAVCLAAPASNGLVVFNAGIAAEPGDSQRVGVPYTLPYKGCRSPGGVAYPSKGNPLAWLWPDTSLT